MSAEVERLRMALAEAGYPTAPVYLKNDMPTVNMAGIPDRIVWQAFRVVFGDDGVSCFDCWFAGNDACGRDGECAAVSA